MSMEGVSYHDLKLALDDDNLVKFKELVDVINGYKSEYNRSFLNINIKFGFIRTIAYKKEYYIYEKLKEFGFKFDPNFISASFFQFPDEHTVSQKFYAGVEKFNDIFNVNIWEYSIGDILDNNNVLSYVLEHNCVHIDVLIRNCHNIEKCEYLERIKKLKILNGKNESDFDLNKSNNRVKDIIKWGFSAEVSDGVGVFADMTFAEEEYIRNKFKEFEESLGKVN